MSGSVQLIHCLRPLHNGAGQGLGGIDRPIMREAHTGLPYVQSSSIKGTARAAARHPDWSKDDVVTCFGPDKGQPGTRDVHESRQGALVITDALLLLFPVRSDAAGWVWTTSPLMLARLGRWCELAGRTSLFSKIEAALEIASLVNSGRHALGPTDDGVLRLSPKGPYALGADAVEPVPRAEAQAAMGSLATALADVLFPLSGDGELSEALAGYWHAFFERRLLLVGDGTLAELTRQHAVVEPGIEIEDGTGTTTEGSLRFTEFLPEESVLFAYLTADAALSGEGRTTEHWVNRVGQLLAQPWQIGGDETKGKGLVRSRPVVLRAAEVHGAIVV